MPFFLNMHTRNIEAEAHFSPKRAGVFIALILAVLVSSACSRGNSDLPDIARDDVSTSESAQSLETLQTLSAPAGLNTERLFNEAAPSDNARFNRLESEVQRLRDDFDLVSPAITRLVAVEQDMRDLMNQLEILLDQDSPDVIAAPPALVETEEGEFETIPVAPTQTLEPVTALPEADLIPAPQAPEPEPVTLMPVDDTAMTDTPEPETTPASSPIEDLSKIESVRIGEHVDKTRIVLDMSDKITYKADMSENGKIVLLRLNNAMWQEDLSWASEKSPVITSWKAEQSGENVNVAFALSYAGRIKNTSYAAPRDGYQRLVIDIFSDEMHLAKE